MSRYNIRYIHLAPPFKFGCLVGGLLLLLPGLLCGLLARAGVGLLREWLESWDTLGLDSTVLPLPELNFLDLLNLSEFLRNLQALDDNGWLLVLLLTLSTVIAGGVLLGFLAACGAAGYNVLAQFSGGLVVSAEVLDRAAAPAFAPVPAKPGTLPLPQAHGGPAPPGPSPHPGPAPPASSVPPAASAWLAFKQNPQQRWPVKAGVTTIGSASGNDVILSGLLAHHAEIRFENNRFILYDLGGGQIAVNERPITGPNMLKNGFSVRLGVHELIFQTGQP